MVAEPLALGREERISAVGVSATFKGRGSRGRAVESDKRHVVGRRRKQPLHTRLRHHDEVVVLAGLRHLDTLGGTLVSRLGSFESGHVVRCSIFIGASLGNNGGEGSVSLAFGGGITHAAQVEYLLSLVGALKHGFRRLVFGRACRGCADRK